MTVNTEPADSEGTTMMVDSSHFESRKIQNIDDSSLLIKPTIAALAYSLPTGVNEVAVTPNNTQQSFYINNTHRKPVLSRIDQ
jgi:hypothetical protein